MWPFSRRKKTFSSQDDQVWYSSEALRYGIAREAAKVLATGPVIVAFHYQDSLDLAARTFASASVPTETLRGSFNAAAIKTAITRPGVKGLFLIQRSQLRPQSAASDVPDAHDVNTQRPPLTVIAWERHSFRVLDDVILAVATELNQWFACSLAFNIALDTPPMTMFAGDKTREILERLGMGPMESIQHKFLTKSIARAQSKVAEKMPADPKPDARSSSEWFAAWEKSQLQ